MLRRPCGSRRRRNSPTEEYEYEIEYDAAKRVVKQSTLSQSNICESLVSEERVDSKPGTFPVTVTKSNSAYNAEFLMAAFSYSTVRRLRDGLDDPTFRAQGNGSIEYTYDPTNLLITRITH